MGRNGIHICAAFGVDRGILTEKIVEKYKRYKGYDLFDDGEEGIMNVECQ